MKAHTLALIANLAPDGGKELQAQQEAQEKAQEAEKAQQEAQEAQATSAALAAVDWDRVHGSTLRRYDLASADYAAAWQVAQRKGDCRGSMGPRPMRPDWYAEKGLAVNDTYAPLATSPKASAWQGPEPRRWQAGIASSGHSKRVVIDPETGEAHTVKVWRGKVKEAKGARDSREAENLSGMAYEARAYEGAAGPHRAPTLEAQQEAQRIAWEAELARVNEGRAKA